MQLKIIPPTVTEFSDIYLEKYAKIYKKTWRIDEGRLRLYIKPAWGDWTIAQVKRADAADLHTEIGQTKPFEANRIVELISKMWSFAIDSEYLPVTFRNPGKGIKEFREKSRARFLTREELTRIYRSILMELDPHCKAAFLLLLCTALRRNEILDLQWENVNLKDGYVRIPDTKNGDTCFQPLNKQAIAILSEIPRYSNNPFVIIGQEPGKPRNTLQKAWARIRDRAEVEDVRIHDLRRTGASFLAQQGVPLHLIGKVLNHKDSKSTEVYARFADHDKRDALDQLGEYFASVADANPDQLLDVDPFEEASLTPKRILHIVK